MHPQALDPMTGPTPPRTRPEAVAQAEAQAAASAAANTAANTAANAAAAPSAPAAARTAHAARATVAALAARRLRAALLLTAVTTTAAACSSTGSGDYARPPGVAEQRAILAERRAATRSAMDDATAKPSVVDQAADTGSSILGFLGRAGGAALDVLSLRALGLW